MTDLTIALSNDLMTKLQELAKQHNVTPEDLVRASVEELVASPEEAFQDALDYVLQKNEKLYQRLAV
jgi:predicted transcriptional regulator